jgi:hypothetical protein
MHSDALVGPMGIEFPGTLFADIGLQNASEEDKQGTLENLAQSVANRAFLVGMKRGSWGERRKLKKLHIERDLQSFVSESRRTIPSFDGWLRESATKVVDDLKVSIVDFGDGLRRFEQDKGIW